MEADWSIQCRAETCAATQTPFQEGESFYTLLFDEKTGFRREDLSETAFQSRPGDAPRPFSFWRSKFEFPPPPAPEALGKGTAEELLRRYMAENAPEKSNARYILALMLERKRILKEVEVHTGEDGQLTRIYEYAKTGEVFLIPDPQLRLDQLSAVQDEVAALLQ